MPRKISILRGLDFHRFSAAMQEESLNIEIIYHSTEIGVSRVTIKNYGFNWED